MIPTWMIRDAELSIYALAVYAALASHSGPGGIRPSHATLAVEARCSERKVRDALKELRDAGCIRWDNRFYDGGGGQTANVYFLIPNGSETPADASPAPGAGAESLPGMEYRPARHEEPTPPAPGADEEEPHDLEPHEGTPAPRKRGSRIPEPFILTRAMREEAAAEGITIDLDAHTREFVDYWRGRAGAGGVKLDWPATWRNWMRKAQREQPRGATAFTTDHGRSVHDQLVARRAALAETKGISA